RKGKNQTMPLIRLHYRNYPNFIARCQDRHIRYNETLDYLDNAEASGRTFILAPTADAGVGGVCRDRSKLEALYTIGYKDAEARMEELLAFLDD
ncbi:MAG TPA: patatin family protein, partial [Methanocorpusculum sp.]|nr:patatin family protein [Methanocorpusculum sp.]